MFSAILILLAMPFTDLSKLRGTQFNPISKIIFFIFVANFLILMQLGAKHVESPFIELGQICTVIYFLYFLIILPSITLLENSLTILEKSLYALGLPKTKVSLGLINNIFKFFTAPFNKINVITVIITFIVVGLVR
jgi:Cytochrome b(C-terminal)/b6/petD